MNQIEGGIKTRAELPPGLHTIFSRLDFKVGRLSNFESEATNFYNAQQQEQRQTARARMHQALEYLTNQINSIKEAIPDLRNIEHPQVGQIIDIEEAVLPTLEEVAKRCQLILNMMDTVLNPMVDTDIVDLITEISSAGEELTFYIQDHVVPVTKRMANQPLYQAYRSTVNELDRMPETRDQSEPIAAK